MDILILRLPIIPTAFAVSVNLIFLNSFTQPNMKTLPIFLLTTFSIAAFAQVEIDQKVVLTGADGNRVIQQLEAPVDGTDAVNKDYVDSAVSGSGGASMPTMVSDESSSTMTFGAAMRYCRDLEEGEFTDWRLASLSEMVYAYVTTTASVSSDTSVNNFWLLDRPTTGCTSCHEYYQLLRFSDGYLSLALGSQTNRVRCVR